MSDHSHPSGDHTRASRGLANMRNIPDGRTRAFDPTMVLDEEKTVTIEFDSQWYTVCAYFTPVVGQPDKMWMRSTNWRCEDEPCGMLTREQAREIWRQLKRLGFRQRVKEKAV